jgi:hypothetical protein
VIVEDEIRLKKILAVETRDENGANLTEAGNGGISFVARLKEDRKNVVFKVVLGTKLHSSMDFVVSVGQP